MSYRTLLVFLDDEGRSAELLQLATAMAEQHSAHLIGLYVIPPLELYVSTEIPIPVEMSDNHLLFHRELSANLRQKFESACKGRDFVAEWREINSVPLSVVETIAELAHTVDLVILGHKNQHNKRSANKELPERVVLSAGRPVIIVPDAGIVSNIGREIFVGWDGSVEATRAVFDALPLLRDADSVTVHRINPSMYDRHRVLGTPAEIVNTLSRHGVNVTLSESDAPAGQIGSELMSYATDRGADLLVMGAYGHSRLREYIFGGTTKNILLSMSIPVLMSH